MNLPRATFGYTQEKRSKPEFDKLVRWKPQPTKTNDLEDLRAAKTHLQNMLDRDRSHDGAVNQALNYLTELEARIQYGNDSH